MRDRLITVDGVTRSCSGWARVLGCDRSTVRQRLRAGWDERAAVTTPPRSAVFCAEPGDTPLGLLGALTATMRSWDGSPAEATQQVELARRLLATLLDRSRSAERGRDEQAEAAE